MQKKIREDPRPACGWQAAAGRSVQIIAAMEYLLQDKTEKIIQAFFKVY